MYKIGELENTIITGDVVEELRKIPAESVDLIFADPPYFMQTTGVLHRVEGTGFNGVDDEWDKFGSYEQYDNFCKEWLTECRRVLKKHGTIWVIGAFQNIYRIGYIMQNLHFWILNDVVWSKPNPVPNFKGTRFTNSNETLLWCSKSKDAKYTFNYKTMKHLNGGKQMKSVWEIGLCIGSERIKDSEGKKAHNTQKPEQLLYNVIASSSCCNDIVLDPFMGTGTTGAVAKRLGRRYIGIEREKKYISIANKRIQQVVAENNEIATGRFDEKPPLVSVSVLIKEGYLNVGESMWNKNGLNKVVLTGTGKVDHNGTVASIHKMSAAFMNLTNFNGWDYWYVKRNDSLLSIDDVRNLYRKQVHRGKNL